VDESPEKAAEPNAIVVNPNANVTDPNLPATDPKAKAKYIREALTDEIAHRRERRQQVFSWASSLLVAIIGGTVGLTFKEGHSLATGHKWILTIAIAVLGLYSVLWVNHHWQAERKAITAINSYDLELGIPIASKDYKIEWPSIGALVFLAGTALAAVWITV
jgi:hypothetical protein